MSTIINGEITDLEEDMIEVSIWPNKEKIYIDFAYKGIPDELPIEYIKPNPEQPRKYFNTEELQELANTISNKGQLS